MNTISKDAYEGDLVSRLRNWRGLHLADGGQLFEEAADEIERLRESADRRGEIAVNRRREIERLRTVIRRIAKQDTTLAIVNGVIYADDEEVCAIGHQDSHE